MLCKSQLLQIISETNSQYKIIANYFGKTSAKFTVQEENTIRMRTKNPWTMRKVFCLKLFYY
jgi:hypothetical protein